MRHDGRVSGPLEYSYDGVHEKPTPQVSPREHRSRTGDEARARRSGSTSGGGSPSPTTASSSSTSNGRSRGESASAKRRMSTPSSPTAVFAPPSTPSPHYGFRRNTANVMAAGRRVSHRSSSAPSAAFGDRDQTHAASSGTADTQLPSPRSISHIGGGGGVNGSLGREGSWGGYRDDAERHSRSAPRHAGDEEGDRRAPGTTLDRHGHYNQYSGASSATVNGDAVDDRRATLRGYTGGDRILQTNEDEAVAALSGERNRLVAEYDRHPGLRYRVLGRAGSSPPTASIDDQNSPSRHLRQQLSPRLHLYSSPPSSSLAVEHERAASLEPGSKRENSEEPRRRRRYSRHAGGVTSPVAESPLPSTSAWFAGFAAAQQQRFEALQDRSPPGHELARWKMLELMRHWMSMTGTRNGLDSIIRDVLADAGIAKSKEAWGGGDHRTPAQRVGASSLKLQEGGSCSSPAVTSASPPSTEAVPTRVSPKNKLVEKSVTAESGGGPAVVTTPPEEAGVKRERVMKDALPAAAEAPAANEVPPTSLSTPLLEEVGPATGAAARPSSARPRRRRNERGGGSSAQEKRASPSSCALSPPAPCLDDGHHHTPVTPEKQVAPQAPCAGDVSPCAAAVACPRTEAASDPRGSPRRLTESPSMLHSPAEVGLPNSSLTSASARHRSRSSNNSSRTPQPLRREATYEEIPRFYFPLGCPTTHETVISGPLSTKHENPHLKITDGVSVSAPMYDSSEDSRLGANAEALVGTGDDSALLSETRRAQKVAPMSQLHALDDRQVVHNIQREFGRLPPFPRHSQRVRLLGGRLRSSGHNHGNLPFAKQELLYKQQFIQCVQRLCSQCFGIPRYFSFLVMRLIQWEVNSGNVDIPGDDSRPQTRQGSSRLGSSSSLLSHTTNGGSGAPGLPSVFLITAQHVKEFYDAHLKNKDTIRRIFDLLILSSNLPNSPAAAASLAASSPTTDASEPSASSQGSSLGATPLRSYLLPHDFVAYIDVLLTYHPGLAFLRQTPDFQTKYLDTVIYRIFYELDRFDRGSIRYSELAASRLVDAFRQVDSAEDINTVLLFFSYEHFYVLYCRFWELDEDRDMLLAPEDLMRYAPEDVMNPCIVQRVFAGVGRRRRCSVPQRIGYEDFVWFCVSEEDKSTPQAIRYWFRVLDLDGDGVLSVYELREFYDATRDKIAQYVQEGLVTFEDVVCQVFDMMRCAEYRGLFLSDLMREPEAAAVALNLLTNVVKFLQFEQRDPFVSHQERLLGGPEQSTWDRFARLEYDRMALEADGEG
ncbi:EF-hand domain pair [Novymonas esmeraldas]|uniref:EF-hand domain pair n=1 Tax=Novymonas esmeraldas TaxID=1808958 RepID=A0AAW0ENM8_9TRYP